MFALCEPNLSARFIGTERKLYLGTFRKATWQSKYLPSGATSVARPANIAVITHEVQGRLSLCTR